MTSETRPLIAAYGCIRNQERKILLVRRSEHDSHPGMWELPGGAVERDEIPERGAEREVLEETGLSVAVIRQLATIEALRKGLPIMRIGFLCEMKDPDQEIILSPEHSSFIWLSPKDPLPLPVSRLVENIFKKGI